MWLTSPSWSPVKAASVCFCQTTLEIGPGGVIFIHTNQFDARNCPTSCPFLFISMTSCDTSDTWQTFWKKEAEVGKRHLLQIAFPLVFCHTLIFPLSPDCDNQVSFLLILKLSWESPYHSTKAGPQQVPSRGRPSYLPTFLRSINVFLRCTLTYLLSSLPFFFLMDARSRSGPSKSSWNRFAFTSENHSPVTNFFFFSSLMEPCIRLKVNENITHQDLQGFNFPWATSVTTVHTVHPSGSTKDPEVFCNHKDQTSTGTKADLLSEMGTPPCKHRPSPLPSFTNPTRVSSLLCSP